MRLLLQSLMKAFRITFFSNGNPLVMTLAEGDAGEDIAIYDIETRALARRTFTRSAINAIWSPDGRRIIYSTSANNEFRMYASNADCSGAADLLRTSPEWLTPNSFSPDGTELVYTVGVPDARKIFVMSVVDPEKSSLRMMQEAPMVSNGQLSPYGHWVAYTSFELGKLQVFIRPYPNINDGKWQVSYEGGTDPYGVGMAIRCFSWIW
jgi:Tol biopolymer transport system component